MWANCWRGAMAPGKGPDVLPAHVSAEWGGIDVCVRFPQKAVPLPGKPSQTVPGLAHLGLCPAL